MRNVIGLAHLVRIEDITALLYQKNHETLLWARSEQALFLMSLA
jgi:hypothetical protein